MNIAGRCITIKQVLHDFPCSMATVLMLSLRKHRVAATCTCCSIRHVIYHIRQFACQVSAPAKLSPNLRLLQHFTEALQFAHATVPAAALIVVIASHLQGITTNAAITALAAALYRSSAIRSRTPMPAAAINVVAASHLQGITTNAASTAPAAAPSCRNATHSRTLVPAAALNCDHCITRAGHRAYCSPARGAAAAAMAATAASRQLSGGAYCSGENRAPQQCSAPPPMPMFAHAFPAGPTSCHLVCHPMVRHATICTARLTLRAERSL